MFAHGTHSRGVLILFANELHFEIKSEYIDTEGRYILVEATIQDSSFLLVNLYAPTKSREQCKFFDDVKSALDELDLDPDCEIIIGGVFNTHLNPTLDNLGGRIETKPSDPSVRGIKGKLRSRKSFPRMKVHTIKYLKIAMICSVIRFVENNRVNRIVICCHRRPSFFPKMQARL